MNYFPWRSIRTKCLIKEILFRFCLSLRPLNVASVSCKANMQLLLHKGHNSQCSDGWGLYAMGALMGGIFTPCPHPPFYTCFSLLTWLPPKTWQMLGSQHPFYGTSPFPLLLTVDSFVHFEIHSKFSFSFSGLLLLLGSPHPR